MSSITAAMTTDASVVSRRSSNRPVKNSSVMITSTATTRPLTWDLAPAPPLTAVFDKLPLTTMPDDSPEPRLPRRARPAPGWRSPHSRPWWRTFGCPEPFSEADQEHSNGWAEQRQIVPPPDAVRQAQRRKAGVDVADDLTPLSSSPKSQTARMLKITATSEPGISGSQRLSANTKIKLNSPTRRLSQWVSGRCLITPQACSKKLPGVFSTPSSFGTWPMMIVKARPTIKPLSTGSEMNDARSPAAAAQRVDRQFRYRSRELC